MMRTIKSYGKPTKWKMTEALQKRIVQRVIDEHPAGYDATDFDYWMLIVEACDAEGLHDPWREAASLLSRSIYSSDTSMESTLRHVAAHALLGLAEELKVLREEKRVLSRSLKMVFQNLRGRDKVRGGKKILDG
jgi:hypothetical protein